MCMILEMAKVVVVPQCVCEDIHFLGQVSSLRVVWALTQRRLSYPGRTVTIASLEHPAQRARCGFRAFVRSTVGSCLRRKQVPEGRWPSEGGRPAVGNVTPAADSSGCSAVQYVIVHLMALWRPCSNSPMAALRRIVLAPVFSAHFRWTLCPDCLPSVVSFSSDALSDGTACAESCVIASSKKLDHVNAPLLGVTGCEVPGSFLWKRSVPLGRLICWTHGTC